jgi:hypothetical protein
MRKPVLLLIAFLACATENNIRTVKNFRAAKERDEEAALG